MDINQGNRLICEFDEWTIEPGMEQEPDPYYNRGLNMVMLSEIKYHTSWEWVMNACKKFDYLPLKDMEYQKHCDNIDNAVTCYEIFPVWNALTEAIQWYNNTQTHQP